MDISLFGAALSSSFLIGLIHGVNPCGHSWLVLAPFVSGERRGARVALLTTAFVGGTALACVLLGLTLGAVSGWIPQAMQTWVDLGVNGLLIVLGLVLVVRPQLLHSHDHDHDHDHDHEHDHDHDHGHDHDHDGHEHHHHDHGGLTARLGGMATAPALFAVGFVNMIVPCPTAAIMYKYAIQSADPGTSAAVFGSYAVGTALSVGVVIFGLWKASSWLRGLERPGLESAVMRAVGVLVMAMGVYAMALSL